MKIAIISDTHSRYEAIETAVQLMEERKVELILHCGDIEDAEAVWLFPGKTHFVFGNCDTDRASLRQAMHGIGAILHEPFGRLELQGKKLAFTHGDDGRLLWDLQDRGEFDYVFHGHTHQAQDRLVGETRVINPGALHRVRTRTFVLLDLPSGETESIVVE
jgi:putative phosphoesterase